MTVTEAIFHAFVSHHADLKATMTVGTGLLMTLTISPAEHSESVSLFVELAEGTPFGHYWFLVRSVKYRSSDGLEMRIRCLRYSTAPGPLFGKQLAADCVPGWTLEEFRLRPWPLEEFRLRPCILMILELCCIVACWLFSL